MNKRNEYENQHIRFLNLVGHEIRNPLNIVRGMAELLSSEVSEKEAVKKLEAILRAVERMVNIVEDAVDAANISEDSLEFKKHRIKTRRCFGRLVEKYELIASKKNINFELDISKDVPELIESDDWALFRISDVLVNNAIKFTDTGSIKVKVSFENQKDEEGLLRVDVTDTGCGMSEAALEDIFKAYTQLDDSSTRSAEGLGVGLFLAKQICNRLKGDLKADSEQGKGSTFSILLPVRRSSSFELNNKQEAKSDPKKPKDKKKEAGKSKSLRFLVVEDDPSVAEILESQLSIYSADIEIAVNGEMALDSFKKNPADLVLMDMRMPKKSGYETTEEIRLYEKENGLGGSVVVAVTADAMKPDEKKAIASGCDYHMCKPYLQADLRALIEKLFPTLKQ